MPGALRSDIGGEIYHALNRVNEAITKQEKVGLQNCIQRGCLLELINGSQELQKIRAWN